MNRIGEFFGLEVGFVPVRRNMQGGDQPHPASDGMTRSDAADDSKDALREAVEAREGLAAHMRKLNEMAAELDTQISKVTRMRNALVSETESPLEPASIKYDVPDDTVAGKARTRAKRKPPAP